MRKILFVTNKLTTGGMEKALYETIRVIQNPNTSITVATAHFGGELLDDFKEICTVKDLSEYYSKAFVTRKTLINNLKKIQPISFVKNLFILLKRKSLSYFQQKHLISQLMPKNTEEYDIAVAYATPYTSYVPYIVENVNAKRKIAWIQLDVLKYLKDIDLSEFEDCYRQLDVIVCDSKDSKNSFITRHPSLQDKTIVLNNPLDVEKIRQKSTSSTPFKNDCNDITICSVGRLDFIKGFDLAISAHKILKEKGYNVKWLVCGNGEEFDKLNESILHEKLDNEFILLGNQKNPYKYMNVADIYVQPSRTESYCITLAEARALKKPIVTTNFPCASEHVIHEHNGFICEMTPESIADAIEKLILSPELREKFSNNTTPVDSDHTKLKQLFE